MPPPTPHPAEPADIKMRHRMHSLQEANAHSPKALPTREATPPSSFTPDSDAETTDDDGAELSAYENVDGDDHPRGSSRPSYAYEASPHAPDTLPEQSTWYQFDTAVLVALASCLGNFLTGGDHLKNILLAGLLVFYLHQVIEGIFHSDPVKLRF